MQLISVLDTKVASTNLGDEIIMDSVYRELNDLFPNAFYINIPTHDRISKHSYNIINQSMYTFVGGTNLLSSDMIRHNQWKINLLDAKFVKNLILMGVGWCKYQKGVNLYTRYLYKKILHNSLIHSVRDSYSERMLKSAGIKNVINTACPTMWRLTPQHCSQIPKEKSREVVLTFTEYNQNYEYDSRLFELLDKHYDIIYYWIQQPLDFEYINKIAGNRVRIINPSLDALDHVLKNKEVDYVGTRLHAGIRALQFKRRTLIIGIDNRAKEISKDTNLPVISREDLQSIEKWILQDSKTEINLPQKNIDEWKRQFIKHNVYNN
jgi:polysaccharide pyruvyl transferase WcaK-like protein